MNTPLRAVHDFESPRLCRGMLTANSSSSRLAEAVVDDLLARYRLLSDAELSEMRKTGASNQELIIAALIAGKMKQPAKKIYVEVKNGSKSWGALLHRAKIDTSKLQKEISDLLELRRTNLRRSLLT